MEKLGRKRTCVLSSIICTVFIVAFPVIPDLWLSMAARFVSGLVGPLAYTISSSLALELVPEFRGVMMSLNSAAFNTGIALGSALGGALLLSFNYETVGVVLGSFMIVPALIYQYKIIYPGTE
jgi:predicted MFS family arabinose efflux permease